jgi:hypothetical protein
MQPGKKSKTGKTLGSTTSSKAAGAVAGSS